LGITPAALGFFAEEQATDQQETIDAIANLATPNAKDRNAVANLTSKKGALTKELTTSNEKLITALSLAPLSRNNSPT
jgi:hypothetical protein